MTTSPDAARRSIASDPDATQPTPPLAVITGASSGIGRELARVFSENGFDLVLCAEDAALDTVADDLPLGSKHTVRADLTTPEGVESLVGAVRALGVPVDVLAANAGVGNAGPFAETPLEADLALIALNVSSAVHLTKRLLPDMIERRHGRILFTASVASTMPGPYYATYAASKAFLLSFAEAIRYELKDAGVTVTALMPGPTDTAFFERANMQDTPVWDAPKDDPADVARDAYDAVMAGKDRVVAGSIKNKLQTASATLLPDTAKAAVHARFTEPRDS